MARLGHAIIRVACSAHIGQLVINDLVRGDEVIGNFVTTVKQLVQSISTHEKDFVINCRCQLPQFIATR
jgi:hypothetical protein